MSKRAKKPLFKGKKWRYGGFSLLLVVGVIAVTILANYLVATLENQYGWQIDMSGTHIFEFSAQTEQTLEALDQDVHIYSLLRSEATDQGSEMVRQLLTRYRTASPRVQVTEIDPVTNPTWANKYDTDGEGLGAGTIIVTNADDSRRQIISGSDLFPYNTQTYTQDSFAGEQLVTGGIIYVTQTDASTAYFLQGHGEAALDDLSHLQKRIQNEGMDAAEINLVTDKDKQLEKGDLLIINAPTSDLSDDERATIKAYIDAGGRIFFSLGLNTNLEELDNFASILRLVDIQARNDVVIEGDPNYYYSQQLYAVPELSQDAAITKPLIENKKPVVLTPSHSLVLSDANKAGRTLTSLLTTSNSSWSVADFNREDLSKQDGDATGPFVMAATAQLKHDESEANDFKLVVVGAAEFLTNSSAASTQGNLDFFSNSLNWLRDEESGITIRAKALADYSLNITNQTQVYVLAAVVLIVMPLIVLIAGIVVYLRRKYL